MSDSRTVTIRGAEAAEPRPIRLLRALAQHPEPLSAPALASLLAEPVRRRGLLPSYDHILRRHEKAGRIERAGRLPQRRGRPATTWRITPAGRSWLDELDQAPALAAAAASEARRRAGQAERAATEQAQALDEARATFNRETPRVSRKRAAQQLRDLGCTLDEIGAVFQVSKERIRQDLLWDPDARPERRKPPRRAKPRQQLTPRQTQVLLDLDRGRQTKNYPRYAHTLWTLKNRGLIAYTAGSGPGSIHGYTLTAEGQAAAGEAGQRT
jgi:DNA-binding PadR family transcriptional regulator